MRAHECAGNTKGEVGHVAPGGLSEILCERRKAYQEEGVRAAPGGLQKGHRAQRKSREMQHLAVWVREGKLVRQLVRKRGAMQQLVVRDACEKEGAMQQLVCFTESAQGAQRKRGAMQHLALHKAVQRKTEMRREHKEARVNAAIGASQNTTENARNAQSAKEERNNAAPGGLCKTRAIALF
eukprot:scaffold193879_cov16-Tisochrysis_lutea.AAC.2